MSQHLRPRRFRVGWPLRVALVLLPLLGAGVLVGCGGSAASAPKGDPVRVTLGAADGNRTVQAGDRLRVTARGGVLTQVTVTGPRGRRLPGALGDGGRSWTATEKAAPSTKYAVLARTKNPEGGTGEVKESLTTATADKLNRLTMNPGSPGAAVGIAQPLSLTFDFPVTDRAAVQRHLHLTTDTPTTGSWGWVKDHQGKDRVDWRPRTYWKPGTAVTLRADLRGVDSGGGRYFARDYALRFTIGRGRVLTVDLDRERLTVVEDGRPVRRIAVSAGGTDRGQAPPTGIFPLLAKEGALAVDAEGTPYPKPLHDALRLTDTGLYAHAAPGGTEAKDQDGAAAGITMSEADADWLYHRVVVGDPFEITGSAARDGSGGRAGDWNIPWDQWRRKSAPTPSS